MKPKSRRKSTGYATCKVCGERLTSPASIARGMGPVCSKKRFAGQDSSQKINLETTLFGLHAKEGQILVGLSKSRTERIGIVVKNHDGVIEIISTYDSVESAIIDAKRFVINHPRKKEIEITLVTRRAPSDLEAYLAFEKQKNQE